MHAQGLIWAHDGAMPVDSAHPHLRAAPQKPWPSFAALPSAPPCPLASPRARWAGHGLLEFVLVTALTGIVATQAWWAWQSTRGLRALELTRERLMQDLQHARWHAQALGQGLEMVALSDCGLALGGPDDWSCGWELRIQAGSGAVPLWRHVLAVPVRVQHSLRTPLQINTRGELGQVGDRWVLEAPSASRVGSQVVCLNSASRLRWAEGRSCN